MAEVSHVTALVIVPSVRQGGTASMYGKPIADGSSLLERGVEAALAWPVDSRVLVLGADAETLLAGVSQQGIDVLIDSEWGEGPAAALRSAFDLVVREDSSDAIVVTWLDRAMPGPGAVGAVIDEARTSNRPIVVAKYRYAVDHPFLVHAELWPRVLGMEGSSSLTSLVATHPEWVTEAWVDARPPARYETIDDVDVRR